MASNQVSSTTISLLEKANYYRELGSLDEAIAVYQEAIKLQANDANIYDILGQAYAQKGDWAGAVANYRKAIELGLDEPFWTYKNLGDALRQKNCLDEAVANYQKAIALNPSNPEAYDSLAQAQSQQGNYLEAIVNYQKAIELGIENPFWTYKNLGDVLQRENRLEEALSVYQKVLKLQLNNSKNSNIATNLKSVKAKQSDSEKNSNNQWFEIHNLGDNHFQQQLWEQAIAFYQQAIELNPDYFWSYYNLGRALSQLERWDEAILSYEKAIELNPNLADLYKSLGDCLLKCKQWERAIYAYKQAIDLQPDLPSEVYERLGEALSKIKKPDKKVQQIEIKTKQINEQSNFNFSSHALKKQKYSCGNEQSIDIDFTKVIVAANPSHATKEEDTFWREVSVAAKKRGWQLIEIAARKIPLLPDAQTIILPARIWQVCEKVRSLDSEGLREDFPWVEPSFLHVLEDWEHRRWELNYFEPKIYPGILRLANFIDTAIRTIRPAVVLTTNKIDHPVALFRKAGLYAGSYTAVIERSPFDDIWIEPDGIFQESVIWSDYEKEKDLLPPTIYKKGEKVIANLIQNPYGFRKQENVFNSPGEVFAKLKRPIFLLPIDNVLWTGWEQKEHPQRNIDYPIYDDPIEAIEDIADCVRKLGGSLVVKKHPSCKYIKPEGNLKDIIFCNADLPFMINLSDVVVTFLTKVAFPSVAMGKPTVTLAYNPIAVSGSTYHCIRQEEVAKTLELALNRHDLFRKQEEFKKFAGWLSSKFYAHSKQQSLIYENRSPEVLVDDLIAAAGNRINDRSKFIEPQIIKNLEDLANGNRKGKYASRSLQKQSSQSPLLLKQVSTDCIKVALDVTRLAEKTTYHSGISRYTREILKLTGNFENISLYPVITKKLVAQETTPYKLACNLKKICGDNLQFFNDLTQPIGKKNVGYESPSWDIFHSPVYSLPSVKFTGNSIRIVTIHDVLHLKYPEFHPNKQEKPAIQSTLESINPESDFVICVSEATKRDFLSFLPMDEKRVTVIPEAADPIYFSPDKQLALNILDSIDFKPNKYVIALCQNDPRKNITKMLEAIVLLYKEDKIRDYRFLFVCRSSYQYDLQRQIKVAGLPESYWRILVDVEDVELASLYSCATAFIYVPLYEGFGLPPLEAMAAGCPVVVSDCSSLPEVVGDGGIYIKPTEVNSIKQGIYQILSDRLLQQRLSDRAKDRASRFSWQKTVHLNTEFYLSLVNQSTKKRSSR